MLRKAEVSVQEGAGAARAMVAGERRAGNAFVAFSKLVARLSCPRPAGGRGGTANPSRSCLVEAVNGGG